MSDKQALPPIESIVPPKTTTKTALIRWYKELGYTVAEISRYLNVRYQQVRNVTTNLPKRAAREDMPELVIVHRDTPDIIEAAIDGALDASLLAERKSRKQTEKSQRRADHLFRAEEDETED